jgi:hypothetical protein
VALSPWQPQMYVMYAAIAVLGAVVYLVGIGVVADKTVYDDQVPGINAAIAGAVLANAAGALLLMAGRRSVTARRVVVLGAMLVQPDQVKEISGPANSATLVGGEGLTHFHRSDCPMAADRNWPPGNLAAHQRAGRRPCGVCTP